MVVGALAVVGYGVYVMLNNNPQPPGAPPWPTAGGPSASPGGPSQQPMPGQADGLNVSLGNPSSSTPGAGTPTPTAGGYVPSGPGAAPPLAQGSPAETNPPRSAYERTQYPSAPVSAAPPATGGSLYGGTPSGPTAGAPEGNRYDAPVATKQPTSRHETTPGQNGGPQTEAALEYARSMPQALRSPAPEVPAGGAPPIEFQNVMSTAKTRLDRGELDAALVTLSRAYENPALTERQQEQLNDLLDQVAGTVIYSKKFPVGAPHRVAAGENLLDISQKYQVPPGLLAKINGLAPGTELTPGQELKVVQGPFTALVNVPKRTLTLMVHGRYAGRFPICLGEEFKQIEGSYLISGKVAEHVRYDGQRFLELKPDGGATAPPVSLAIVGMTDPTAAERGQAQGLIAVTPQNADDLYDILSQGSQVTIRR